MDLNKAFYITDDLDIDLKQVAEPTFEEAQLDLKNLYLDEETRKNKSCVGHNDRSKSHSKCQILKICNKGSG